MKCLDTNFLIAVLHGEKRAVELLEKLVAEGAQATTAVNAFELLYGALRSNKPDDGILQVTRLLSRLDVLQFDGQAASLASGVHAQLVKVGTPLDFRDLFIAAIALSNKLPVVTRNARHFSRIKGLSIEEW